MQVLGTEHSFSFHLNSWWGGGGLSQIIWPQFIHSKKQLGTVLPNHPTLVADGELYIFWGIHCINCKCNRFGPIPREELTPVQNWGSYLFFLAYCKKKKKSWKFLENLSCRCINLPLYILALYNFWLDFWHWFHFLFILSISSITENTGNCLAHTIFTKLKIIAKYTN